MPSRELSDFVEAESNRIVMGAKISHDSFKVITHCRARLAATGSGAPAGKMKRF
jgi:hypothetical protein